MRTSIFLFLAIVLALGAYWALASVGTTPTRRCGTAMGPNRTADTCYWGVEERIF